MSCIYSECPYCDNEIEFELENQNQFDTYEGFCCKCSKKFNYHVVFSADIYTSKLKEDKDD